MEQILGTNKKILPTYLIFFDLGHWGKTLNIFLFGLIISCLLALCARPTVKDKTDWVIRTQELNNSPNI